MDYVKDTNQKKYQDLFITTIEDVQNARYITEWTPQFVLAVLVSQDPNLTILKTEKHIIITQYV